MNEDESLRQELSAEQANKRPLGTDAEGRDHYWFPLRQLVSVAVDGEIAHVEDVEDLGRWVDYTADHVGWDPVRYTRQAPLAQIAGQLQTREGAA